LSRFAGQRVGVGNVELVEALGDSFVYDETGGASEEPAGLGFVLDSSGSGVTRR
jgi:hypothetical protein